MIAELRAKASPGAGFSVFKFNNGRGCFGDPARFSLVAKFPGTLIPMVNKSLDPTTQTGNFTKCITTAT